MIREHLKRIASLSEQIMNRLDSGEKISAILPQVRLLAQTKGDNETEAWLNMEIYGVLDVPEVSLNKAGGSVLPALRRFLRLRKAPNYDRIDLDEFVYRPSRAIERARKSDKAYYGPISGLESPQQDVSGIGAISDRRLAEAVVKSRLYQAGATAAAQRVRAYAYDYVGQCLDSALRELDNIDLLGPDYPLAINSLDALESGVGQELVAALDDLRSTNPASWSGAVLICRNVVLKLGRQLCTLDSDQYESALDGKTLEVGAQKEKNNLYSYIDHHHSSETDQSARELLEEAHDLVHPIYVTGSKGKRGTEVTHAEAQKCVVNTFRLVQLLLKTTTLKPLDSDQLRNGFS
jgi:hypothetical protein